MVFALPVGQPVPLPRLAANQHSVARPTAIARKAFLGYPLASGCKPYSRRSASFVSQAEAKPSTYMQPSLQTLVQQSFALGPYKQHKLGRAALFTTRFGLVVFVIGLATLLFPDALGAFMHTGIVTAGERRALQTNGVVVAVVGYFYFIAGRNNAEWFFAGSILDRFAASAVALVLMLIGSASLKQVAGQMVLDVGSAIYTYNLYQQDLADKQQQQD